MELSDKSSKGRVIASGVIPFAFVILMMVYIFGPGADLLDLGIPLPEITIEKVDFVDSEIQATVRNTGPIPVEVAMADINDRIQPAAVEPDRFLERFETTLVRIPKSNKSAPGPKMYTIIKITKANGITPLAMTLPLDDLSLSSIFYILCRFGWIIFYKKYSNPSFL